MSEGPKSRHTRWVGGRRHALITFYYFAVLYYPYEQDEGSEKDVKRVFWILLAKPDGFHSCVNNLIHIDLTTKTKGFSFTLESSHFTLHTYNNHNLLSLTLNESPTHV